MRKILASVGAVALLVGGVAGLSAAHGGGDDEPNCQHYSLKGNSGIGKDETPVWPADYWQANTKQEPHLAGNGQPATWVGVEGVGLHYTSNESSGKRDWFYYACVVSEPSPTPSQSTTTPAAPTPPASQTPTPTPSQSTTPPAGPTPPASQTPTTTPAASVTPTATPPAAPPATPKATPPATPKVTETPKAAEPKPSTTTPAKAPAPAKAKAPAKAPAPAKPRKTSPPLPTCEDVAKEQAGKTYAKDSPEANGIPCR
jgi:pyruvate/2-oxoglutarate dehydrogenase complex dihydrolipoamide acyltransferase (E2) component